MLEDCEREPYAVDHWRAGRCYFISGRTNYAKKVRVTRNKLEQYKKYKEDLGEALSLAKALTE